MRLWAYVLMTLATCSVAGCAAPKYPHIAGFHPALVVVDASDRHDTAILFDRQPGSYRAEDFNYRSDWPSTFGYYSPGQITVFNEYLIDYQNGGSQSNWDYTYRRSDTRRYSVGYR